MKPIQLLAGVAAVIILGIAGWMFLGNTPQEVEPVAISEEATVAPTEESIVVVEPETPTEVPTLLPTETAVPATETAVPATEIPLPTETPLPTVSPTPERILITHPNDLIGTWQFTDPYSENTFRFYPNGTLAIAYTLAHLEAGDIALAADYWFEDGLWWTREPSIYPGQSTDDGSNNTCRINGRWFKGRFKVVVQDEQTLRFITIGSCPGQNDWIAGTYTRLTAQPIDLHIDPGSGLVINPDTFPDDMPFIVEGTLMEVDLTSTDVPQLLVRLPSGETANIVTQAIDQILDTVGTHVDLTAYEYEVSPVNPLRVRATVQMQNDGVLTSDDLIVIAVE